MKKIISLFSLFAILSVLLCSCGNACEHCGKSTLAYNQVGDSVDGIRICNDCVDKMRLSKLHFDFSCEGCDQEKLGKKNNVTVDGEEKIICNTCNIYFQENGALPQ